MEKNKETITKKKNTGTKRKKNREITLVNLVKKALVRYQINSQHWKKKRKLEKEFTDDGLLMEVQQVTDKQ